MTNQSSKEKIDAGDINKIRSLIYTQQPENTALAFQLMVSATKMPVEQALRILFVELLTLREHTGCSGRIDDPFVDFTIYELQIRYYWDSNGIYYRSNGKTHCILEMDRYRLLHPNNIREHCIQHFHQRLYQFGYLVEQQMKKSLG
jgi:hypothetical protein